eukprot:COSAG06_NODE_7584_length_2451_cov_19.465561_1_plen_168_part_10
MGKKGKKKGKAAPAPAPQPSPAGESGAGGDGPKLSRAERRAKEREAEKSAKKAARAKVQPVSAADQKGRTEVAKGLWSTATEGEHVRRRDDHATCILLYTQPTCHRLPGPARSARPRLAYNTARVSLKKQHAPCVLAGQWHPESGDGGVPAARRQILGAAQPDTGAGV